MRIFWVIVAAFGLTACSLYFDDHGSNSGFQPDAGTSDDGQHFPDASVDDASFTPDANDGGFFPDAPFPNDGGTGPDTGCGSDAGGGPLPDAVFYPDAGVFFPDAP